MKTLQQLLGNLPKMILVLAAGLALAPLVARAQDTTSCTTNTLTYSGLATQTVEETLCTSDLAGANVGGNNFVSSGDIDSYMEVDVFPNDANGEGTIVGAEVDLSLNDNSVNEIGASGLSWMTDNDENEYTASATLVWSTLTSGHTYTTSGTTQLCFAEINGDGQNNCSGFTTVDTLTVSLTAP
jgi:hypothetical protein